jgi:hypothetical protein
MLSKEQLLAALQPSVEEISVKGLPDKLRVKIMDGFTRDALQKTLQTLGTSDSIYFSAVVSACVVDEAGAPYFSESDLETLRGLNAELIRKIGLECQRINALGQTAVDEAEKNSEAIQNTSSGIA